MSPPSPPLQSNFPPLVHSFPILPLTRSISSFTLLLAELVFSTSRRLPLFLHSRKLSFEEEE